MGNDDKIVKRYQNLMKGFTGQWLTGGNHDQRHCRNYEETPNVNKELLASTRWIGNNVNAKAVNFILFHDCYLNDDDMYWLSSIFNTYTPKGLAVNTVDLSNNCLTLVRDPNLTYVDLPFFSFNAPYNTPRNILRLDLSNNKINDEGAAIIANGLANGVLPITKLLNLGGNQITPEGFQNMMDIISHIDQEIFIITEKNESEGEGKAVFKSTDGHLYDFSLKSDGKECAVEFGDGITGISGISAGDTCPAPVKDQIHACFLGGVSGAMKGLATCKETGKSKLVCIAKDAFLGCSIATTSIALKPCTSLGSNYRDHDHDSNFGFSATGGTEIKGSYIDNSRGPMGSSFDLSQHDF